MLIAFPKEPSQLENRVAVSLETVKKFCALGINVAIESGLGNDIFITDQQFQNSGAKIEKNTSDLLCNADVIIRFSKPESNKELKKIKPDSLYISFLDPFNDPKLIKDFAENRINSISMEMVPRTTKAQNMDSLSSQANLSGYTAVIIAAEKSKKALPMMVTSAGTISPSKVFVIGVGVAGLQAIATAKRLGAKVEAFDTRPETEEQVKSLGAKFISINLGETEKTKEGYAKELTKDQLKKQQDEMAKICAKSDIIITTAQVFGRKAPILITKEMLQQIQPGTVIIDMAAHSGGNVEGTIANKDTIINGVTLVGHSNLAGNVAVHASQMYANNIYNLINHLYSKDSQTINYDLTDEIIKGCLITHNGAIVNERIQ